MEDIASLGLSIDSSPLTETNRQLDKFPASAGAAERSAKSLGDAVAAASAKAVAATGAQAAAMDAAVANVTRGRTQYDIMGASVTKAAAAMDTIVQKSAGMRALSDAIDAASVKNTKLAASTAQAASALPAVAASAAATQAKVDAATVAVNKLSDALAFGSSRTVGKAAESAGTALVGVLGPIGLVVAGTVAAAAAYAVLVVEAAKVSDALAEQQRRLGTLLGSQNQAAAAYKDIAGFASAVGISVGDATEKFVAFARAGQAVGAVRQNIIDITSVAEKLTQLSGANPAEGGAAQQALAGMLKDSVVSAAQLTTVLDNVPQIVGKIADGLGVSVTQLRLMAQQGDLSNKQVFDALLSQTKAVDAEFAQMPKSIGSTFRSLGDDLGQLLIRFANLLPLVREYRSAIELAAVAAKALNDATKQETPAQVIARTVPLMGTGAAIDTRGRDVLGIGQMSPAASAAASAEAAKQAQKEFSAAIAQMMADFEDQQGAASTAVQKLAAQAILDAVAIADKLDAASASMKEFQRQTETAKKGLDAIQGGFSGLDSATAVQQTKSLTDALQLLQDKSLEATTAYGKALDALAQHGQQSELGMTPGQIATQAQVKTLTLSQPGIPTEAAQGIVTAQQGQMLDDMIQKQGRELIVQTAITQALRGGKAAADEAAVAMQVLGIAFEQLGTLTPELQVKLDVLAQTLGDIKQQAREQATIEASKPLEDDLAAIAAAMKVVEQGSYAMKLAQQQARSALSDNGTGGLQLEVFNAQQALTDAATLKNLSDQLDLTKKLAAAAGDVAAQKKIQLDYDIKQAQMNAAPGAAAGIDQNMRDQAAAKQTLDLANGSAEMQRQLDLTKQQTDLVRNGSADYAAQLAMMQKRNELEQKFGDISQNTEAQRQIDLAGEQARANVDLQRAQDAAAHTKQIWQNAYDNIQSAIGDAFYNAFSTGVFNAKSAADAMKQIFLRTLAEIAAAAIIRPIVQPIFAAGQSAGIIPNGVGGTSGIGSGGGGLGMPSIGGTGATSWMGDFGSWLNTPFISAFAPAVPAGGYTDVGSLISAQNLGQGLTPLGAFAGAASIGLGAYNLINSKSAGGAIGGAASILGGGLGIAGALAPAALGGLLGPIGMGIGLLGAFLPGLLGGNTPPPPKVMATGGLNFNAGKWNYNGSEYNGGQGLGGTLGGVGGTMKSLMDAAGVTSLTSSNSLNYQTLSQGQFSNATTFVNGMQWGQGSGNDAGLDTAAAHIAHMIMMEPGSGISDLMRQGLGNYGQQNLDHAFSTQELSTAVSELKALDTTMKDLGRTITPAETALKQIDDQFKALTDTATKYGLDTTKIDSEQAKARTKVATDFADGIQRQIDDMSDPTKGLLSDLDKAKQDAIDNNNYILANVVGAQDQIANIEALYGAKRAAIVEAAAKQAQAYWDTLAQGQSAVWSTTDPTRAQFAALNTSYAKDYAAAWSAGGSVDGQGPTDKTLALTDLADQTYHAQRDKLVGDFIGGLEAGITQLNDPMRAQLDALAKTRDANLLSAAAIKDATGNTEALTVAQQSYDKSVAKLADDFVSGLATSLTALVDPMRSTIDGLQKQRDTNMVAAQAIADATGRTDALTAATALYNAQIAKTAGDFTKGLNSQALGITDPVAAQKATAADQFAANTLAAQAIKDATGSTDALTAASALYDAQLKQIAKSVADTQRGYDTFTTGLASQLTSLTDPMTGQIDALKASRDANILQAETIRDATGDTTALTAATALYSGQIAKLAKDFTDGIADQKLAIDNPMAAQLAGFAKTRDANVLAASALGIGSGAAIDLYSAQVNKTVGDFVKGLSDQLLALQDPMAAQIKGLADQRDANVLAANAIKDATGQTDALTAANDLYTNQVKKLLSDQVKSLADQKLAVDNPMAAQLAGFATTRDANLKIGQALLAATGDSSAVDGANALYNSQVTKTTGDFIKSLGDQITTLNSPVQAQIQALDDAYTANLKAGQAIKDTTGDTTALTLATTLHGDAIAKIAKDFTTGLNNQATAVDNPVQANLDALAQQFDANKKAADAIDAATGKTDALTAATDLYSKQIAKLADDFTKGLKNQTLGVTDPMAAQLAGFQDTYNTNLKAANAIFASTGDSSGIAAALALYQAQVSKTTGDFTRGLADQFTALDDPMKAQLTTLREQYDANVLAANAIKDATASTDALTAANALYQKQTDKIASDFSSGIGTQLQALQNPMAAQIAALNQQYTANLQTAQAIEAVTGKTGLAASALALLNAQLDDLAKKFTEKFTTGLLSLTDPTRAQLTTTASQQADDLQSAAALGGGATAAVQAYYKAAYNKTATDFQNTINQGLETINDPLQAQIDALHVTRDAALQSAQAINDFAATMGTTMVDTLKTAEYYTQQEAQLRKTFYSQELSGLESLIQQLTYGTLSGASPSTMLSGTRAAYQTTLAAAQGGDTTALQNLTTMASDYANSARTYFGSSAEYYSTIQDVRDALQSLDVNIRGGNVAPGDTSTAGSPTDPSAWAGIIASLQTMVQNQNQQISDLREELSTTNALLTRTLVNVP